MPPYVDLPSNRVNFMPTWSDLMPTRVENILSCADLSSMCVALVANRLVLMAMPVGFMSL